MDLGGGFESVLRYVVITAVVFAIGIPLRLFLRKRALKKYPELAELQKIKDEIRSLKGKGSSYSEIISEIKSHYKFPKYIIEGFIIDVENEEKTLVENPKNCTKSNLEFEYPQNWKIKPLDPKLDAEKNFTVEGSYSGIITFSIFENEASDVPSLEDMNEFLAVQYKYYKAKDTITKWGHFMGNGNTFTAMVLNNSLSGKVFRYIDKNRGFYLTMAFMDDDYANVSEGFKMIENTLKEWS